MPRVIQTTVYKYEELNDKAKEKARDWYREISRDDNDFADCLTEEGGDFENVASFMGWTIDKRKTGHGLAIWWTGFWSQGDGLCFEGEWKAANVDAEKLKQWAPKDGLLHQFVDAYATLAKGFPSGIGKAEHRDRYCHEYSVSLSFGSDGDLDQEPSGEQVDEFTTLTRGLMKWMYRNLEEQYEHHNSDANIGEIVQANEYEFTEDGKRA